MKKSKILILSAALISLAGLSSCSKRSEVVPSSQPKTIVINEDAKMSMANNRLKIKGTDDQVLYLVNDEIWDQKKVEQGLNTNEIASVSVFKNTQDASHFIQKMFGNNPEILEKSKNGLVHVYTKDYYQSHVKSKTSGKKPFTLVDGKEITSDQMNAIDPNTIEKMEVLKGENAVSKYGEKAKDGAVIITLKK